MRSRTAALAVLSAAALAAVSCSSRDASKRSTLPRGDYGFELGASMTDLRAHANADGFRTEEAKIFMSLTNGRVDGDNTLGPNTEWPAFVPKSSSDVVHVAVVGWHGRATTITVQYVPEAKSFDGLVKELRSRIGREPEITKIDSGGIEKSFAEWHDSRTKVKVTSFFLVKQSLLAVDYQELRR
jgi:hypothetical protein